jgi:PIN domain nuclease of toxin-antitoxin system
VKFLLDTGVFLLALAAPERLSRRARQLLTRQRSGLFLSAASSWEIGAKFALGKLDLPEPPAQYVPTWMLKWGIQGLDISHSHALRAGNLPPHHQDPFDRMLIAQAMTEGMALATADRLIESYDVKVFWCGR